MENVMDIKNNFKEWCVKILSVAGFIVVCFMGMMLFALTYSQEQGQIIPPNHLSEQDKIFLQADEAVQNNNFQKAIEILIPLAREGNSEALNLLGNIYHSPGTHQDYGQALNYYHQASDKGHKVAPNHIAGMYLNGEGVGKNELEAFKWYRISARRGYALGQYNVGLCYEKGIGVKKNLQVAGSWYGLAEKNQPGLLKNIFYGQEKGMSLLYSPSLSKTLP